QDDGIFSFSSLCPSFRVNPQACNDRGYSPLALASDYGRAQVVRLLTVAGADTESRDHRGNSPLMHASREVKSDKK
ncbi:unnamed protein product, partial [Hapterophycus canaliculatus]